MMIQPADQSPELTPLERSVLETALATVNVELRRQIETVTVLGRTPSGVGFMTKLMVPEEQRIAADDPAIPVVAARHPALPSGAEFVLQVRDGRLNSIEGFCHEGLWPGNENEFSLVRARNGAGS